MPDRTHDTGRNKQERGATGTGPYRPFIPEFPTQQGPGAIVKGSVNNGTVNGTRKETEDKGVGEKDAAYRELQKMVQQQAMQIERITVLLEKQVMSNNAAPPPIPQLPTPISKSPSAEDQQFLINLVKATLSNVQGSSSETSTQSRIKVVPIELGKFDGSYMEYPNFIQTLDYHMKNQPSLTEINKFAILRAHLEGAAADKVRDLKSINPTSYKTARELLHEVYGDRHAARDIAVAEFNAYVGTHKYKGGPMEAATDRLRILVTRCRESEVPEAYLTTSVGDLLRKLPKQVREDLLNYQDNKTLGVALTMEDVLRFMRKHARRTLRNERANPAPIRTPRFSGTHLVQSNGQTTTGSQQTNPQPAPRPPTTFRPQGPQMQRKVLRDFEAQPCFYCDEKHTEFMCRLPHEKKLQKVRDKKACPNCLSTSHDGVGCQRGWCIKCKERHHTMLCALIPSNVAPSGNGPPKANEGSHLATHSAQKRCIQTYFATEARNPVRNISSPVVALVDQGSTDSFILEATATRLKLPTLGYHNLRSATCFSGERQLIKARRVEMDLQTKTGGSFRIEALAVDNLVPDITIQPVKLLEQVLKFINDRKGVANAPPVTATTTEVHILLENGIYGRVMRPTIGCQQLDENQDLVAYSTPFGMILSGATETTDERGSGVEVFYTATKMDEIGHEDPLVTEIRNGWMIENLGISLSEAKPDRAAARPQQTC